ncbi:X-ray repair cross-complementing protein 5 [Hyalella azteca]|uniref:X-ray repair cross-complementing protein 5 n=1 Tax=Hyalella azteca TaxID=294128 RepID=A0A8B7PMT6_HYAAZ|nr:X-ray repair cross-complementing protein 5 [Hyalella azteca]
MPPAPGRKATCEGIVVVLDVGPHTRLGLPIEKTFYNKAKLCLINILQRKIFADKCRDKVGILLLGTDETDNPLAKPGEYQHITVLQSPREVDWACVEAAQKLPRGSHAADWLDALVIAIDLLHDPMGDIYSATKIVLLTDFCADFSADQTDVIISSIKAIGADFSVIGPDVSGENPTQLSWSGKPKTTVQRAGEALAAKIVQAVDGIICSFDEAIPQLLLFQKKTSGSSNWNAMLSIGEDLRIPITGRIKMRRATPNTWKRCHATDDSVVTIKEKSYHRTDDQQTAVPEDEVIDGYRYGTTLVPFTDEDRQMNYSSGAESAELSVLGFTRSEFCGLAERAGDQVLLVTAKEGDEDAAVALSAVVQAMAELDVVAVVRRVYRRGCKPVLGALYPSITQDYECLVWVALPYREDVRALAFPPLQRHVASLTQQQTHAIDALIDAMNLNITDSDGDAEELLDPETVLNPHLQHYYNCLTDRALTLTRPLPQPHSHVTALLSVPVELREALDGVTERLVQAFPTTKIVKRTKRERHDLFGAGDDANESKRSRGDEDENVEPGGPTAPPPVTLGPRVDRVSTATPLQDFQVLLSQQPFNFFALCDDLGEVLLQIVETISQGLLSESSPAERASIDKIVACMQALRKECVIISADTYNSFIRSMHALCLGRGVLNKVWGRVAELQLGLITSAETPKSSVDQKEAEDFLSVDVPSVTAPSEAPAAQMQDYDDLLDDL